MCMYAMQIKCNLSVPFSSLTFSSNNDVILRNIRIVLLEFRISDGDGGVGLLALLQLESGMLESGES